MRKILLASIILSFVIPALAQETTATDNSTGHASQRQLPDAPQPGTQSLRQRLQLHGSARAQTVLPSASEPAQVASLEGTRAQLSLLTEVSSKLPSGTRFQAQLEEPVLLKGQTVLPKGALLEGHLQTARAHRPMRPGSVFMSFDRLLLPSGTSAQVGMNLLAIDSNSVKTDDEGGVHPALSKKRLVIQLGGTLLTAKFADDLAQVAGGTAVSAGTARYIGFASATAFLLIQKGREVKLHPGDRLEVEFGRGILPAPTDSR